MKKPEKIAIIGLGYIGLPLAVALAKHFPVVGFDIDTTRIEKLQKGYDCTGEISSEQLAKSSLQYNADVSNIKGADLFIITTPTPIDTKNQPDLGAVVAACKSVAPFLTKGAVVVLESTVYPGVTEDTCGPELEYGSGLTCGVDFFLGYSPERLNPGDKEYSLERVIKVIAGQTETVAGMLAVVYGAVNSGNIFRARNIKTAEAAKVIENAQRDLNIAFINEAAIIFNHADISIHDVLDAARTKWNFIDFAPGLVGGHCIGVDPYYLTYFAENVGFKADLSLTARRTNNALAPFIAGEITRRLDPGARVLVMGLTFKEDVPDLRNSKAMDLIHALMEKGLRVDVFDPLADPEEVKAVFDIRLLDSPSLGAAGEKYDNVVGVVAHQEFRALKQRDFEGFLKQNGLIADIKGIWRGLDLPGHFRRWTL